MGEKTCQCNELKWECWIKEYDSDNPNIVPGLWFSTECAACGDMNFMSHGELDESTIPKEILARGLAWLKRQEEEKACQIQKS